MQEIVQTLQKKADKEDILQLFRQKTNKSDSDMQIKAIAILHKQLVHAFVLLIEFGKLTLTSTKETEMSKQSRRNYLLEQSIHVLQWAQEFDP